MIDHVGIRLPSLAEGQRFYGRALELLGYPGEPDEGGGFVEWDDFAIGEATADRPVTRRLHVGFYAPSREAVDAWWRALTAAGYESDGAPGPRPAYGPDYYGALRPRSGGQQRRGGEQRPAPAAGRDRPPLAPHPLARGRDPVLRGGLPCRRPHRRALRRPHPDPRLGRHLLDRRGPPTENLHLAFAAPDRETVAAFHEAGIAAGFASNGEPGERPVYHAGLLRRVPDSTPTATTSRPSSTTAP